MIYGNRTDILSDTSIRRRLFEHRGKLAINGAQEDRLNKLQTIEAFQDFDESA